MKFLNSINILEGWLPVTLWILGAIGIIVLLLPRRQKRWFLKILLLAVVAVGLVYATQWLLIWVFYVLSDPLPTSALVWGSVGMFALLLGIAGMKGIGFWRRAAAPVAVLAAILVASMQINAYFGQYVTVGSLLNAESLSLPALNKQEQRSAQKVVRINASDAPAARGWKPPVDMPSHGKLVGATIPGTSSGFKARQAIIYLPPAYLTTKRPLLPVLVLVAGQPGSPQRWVDAGHLDRAMNNFAASHHGLAPVVVVVDPNGSLSGNTMCMDSQLGDAGTYLAVDVPAWIKTNLDVQTNTSRWAFGGFSFGGTCAIQMGAEHPTLYPNIIDLSGQLEPALTANRTVTIQRSFGGNTQAFDAKTPLALLSHKTYANSFAYLSVGANDTHFGPGMDVLASAAKAAGMGIVEAKIPGSGHSWASARTGFSDGLNVVAKRMGMVN